MHELGLQSNGGLEAYCWVSVPLGLKTGVLVAFFLWLKLTGLVFVWGWVKV